jgi:hypothetical protein
VAAFFKSARSIPHVLLVCCRVSSIGDRFSVLEVRFLHGSSTYNQADWLGHRRGTSNSQLLQRSVPLPHKIGRPRWSAVAVDTISRDKGNTAAGAVVVHAFSHFSAFSAASTAPSPTTPPFLLWPRLRSTDREGERPSNACLQNVGSSSGRVVIREWSGERGRVR